MMEVMKEMVFKGRALCITRELRLSSSMHGADRDDVVAVLEGADRLFILRPSRDNKHYRLIGDAYVDGLMNGEAYKGIDLDEVAYDIELA